MKQIIVFFMVMFIGCSLFSQEKNMNQTVFDSTSDHEIMIGFCTLAGITDTLFNSSFRNEYDRYTPDQEIVSQVASLLDEITITIVMGTWCSDSREQVPRFMKILNLSGYSVSDPVIICTDRNKKAGDLSLEGLDILKVPTIIIYHSKRELGRIIETPQTTLEQDFLAILKKQL